MPTIYDTVEKAREAKQFRWYIAYTKSRWEKKVERQLHDNGIFTYLPIRKTLKHWSDRQKVIEEVFFKSYIFINTNLKGYYHATGTDGLMYFLKTEGKPVELKESEIELIRKVTSCKFNAEVVPNKFSIGDKVLITKGCLKGISGILIQFRGKHRVAVALDSIEMVMLVELPLSYLEKIN